VQEAGAFRWIALGDGTPHTLSFPFMAIRGRLFHRSMDAACVLEKRGVKITHSFMKVGVRMINLIKHMVN